jgi:hypothetical protein
MGKAGVHHLPQLSVTGRFPFMENITRLGEFRRGIEAGAHVRGGVFVPEVTLDFARVGARISNHAIIPFFNAQLEGVDRAARAFKDNRSARWPR